MIIKYWNVINVDIIVEAINHFISSHSKVDLGCGLAAFCANM